MSRFTPLLGIGILLVACGKAPDTTPPASPATVAESAAPAAATAAAGPATAAPPEASAASSPALLRLKATVKDDTYKDAPSCMVTFTIENRHTAALAVFSAAFVPQQASTGKALTTATEFAGISVGVANLPLEPGATSKPWKQNILGTACGDVAVRFEGNFMCSYPGRPCKPEEIEVDQQGLASLTGLGS